MKKLLAALLLIVIVVAVSYYQSERHQDDIQRAYSEGESGRTEDLARRDREIDSLQHKIEQIESSYADSLRLQGSVSSREIDSLKRRLKASVAEAAQQATADGEEQASVSDRHLQILAYYKERFRNLPSDLSAYERKAALTEIRIESAEKFAISVDELNRIRKKNNLDY
jgi:hypothetical protein